MVTNRRQHLEDKKRIIIKVGSSSLCHAKTGRLDLFKMEVLVRQLTDLHAAGRDVVLVSSGAINTGRHAAGLDHRPSSHIEKQACASIGQARLMMIYQKLFAEYNTLASQVLMTKENLLNEHARENARNTFEELFRMGVIPIVNENDTISTDELGLGDNDTLSAVVAALTGADLLILLSDIDGLYTADPNLDASAEFISEVDRLDQHLLDMAGDVTSDMGTGGMKTKITAAQIAGAAGADMIIANGADFHILHHIMEGRKIGTLFKSDGPSIHSMEIIERILK